MEARPAGLKFDWLRADLRMDLLVLVYSHKTGYQIHVIVLIRML